MIIQPVYPHFVGGGQQLSPAPNSVHCDERDQQPMLHRSQSPPMMHRSHSPPMVHRSHSPPMLHRSHSPHRPVPLRHRSVSPPTQIIYRPEPIFTRPNSPTPPMHKYDIGRIIKRCNSIDEEFYPEEHIVQSRIVDAKHRTVYDSDHELEPRHEHFVDTVGVASELGEEDDEPLDLSLPVGRRRRDRAYSDSESDDSGGPGEEKMGGDKAAYKKSLMKRYCKYKTTISIIIPHMRLKEP